MPFNDDQTPLTFDDLHYEEVEEDLQELAEEEACPSGTYVAICSTYNMYADAQTGRQFANLRYTLLDENGGPIRNVRLKVSWIKEYSQTGRIDKYFRHYGKLRTALGVDSASPKEVLPTAKDIPIRLRVSETYRVEEPEHVHPMHQDLKPTDEGHVWASLPVPDHNNADDVKAMRAHYIGFGLEPIILVQGVAPDITRS